MAEFIEVMHEYQRMCDAMYRCEGCPMYSFDQVAGQICPGLTCPEQAENIIMQWAKDHPKAVYPTWNDMRPFQKPLSLEEAKRELSIWLEIKSDEKLFPALIEVRAKESWFCDGRDYFIRQFNSEYGTMWRCWATKPTDEERMTAKWDSE